MQKNTYRTNMLSITLGNKIFATLKWKCALEYIWGADFKSAFIFALERQVL